MPIKVKSNYAGEVLEEMLVRATTGNEIVEKGLIRVVPKIKFKKALPRLKTGKMLQKPKEQPELGDSKGDFSVDEKVLFPKEIMVFTTFNPNAFDTIWRKWQPTGNLVFTELSTEIQNTLLEEMTKSVDFEMGAMIINGEYADSGDEKLFDGILKRIKDDEDTIKIGSPVAITESNILDTLKKVYKNIPDILYSNKNLRILMSFKDFGKYDDALSALPSKGTAYTDENAKRFKGIKIEVLADMPESCIVATLASNDAGSNLHFGVGELSDSTTIQIDKVTNAGELYFFKMKMKADTQIGWGGYVVLYDARG